jgi:hypothetical protein
MRIVTPPFEARPATAGSYLRVTALHFLRQRYDHVELNARAG